MKLAALKQQSVFYASASPFSSRSFAEAGSFQNRLQLKQYIFNKVLVFNGSLFFLFYFCGVLFNRDRTMESFAFSYYINPLTDFGFNRLFFTELNKDLLIDFLNGILPDPDKIVDLQYQPTVHFGDLEGERKAIFDIFCTNEKGEYLIVEMQRAKQAYFRDRSLFYASCPIRNQAPKGKWDFQLKAVYFIGLLDFVLFDEAADDANYYLEYVQLIRRRTATLYSKKLNFAFVELPKFRKTESELVTNADRWLFCLRNLSRLTSRPEAVQGRIFEKLFKAAEIKRLTTTEMEAYRKSILEYDDVRSAVDCAREEGVNLGVKKGVLKGREEGINIGVVKTKKKMVRNCLLAGMSTAEISKLTELSEEEVRAIAKGIQ
ncbi:MAG: Rpn family recombination-promoting nuclease/putative transposase [Massilibacteroides sp.]|nr:Rpn family recombination-promoting nuclease/putative transposase [Massilibacteroides sp.]